LPGVSPAADVARRRLQRLDGSTETLYFGRAGAALTVFPDDAMSLPTID
jgi:hypothetical protein